MKKYCILVLLISMCVSSINICAQNKKKDVKPYLVVLSMDGFRWDYPDSFATPNLHRMAKKGVKAKSLIPSFPSVTFPNHYTIATGLYPDHHGIVHNEFFDSTLNYTYKIGNKRSVEDGRFYGGEPIWNTAEKQNVKSGEFFWVGSEANIQGMRPTYWKSYDSHITFEQRIDSVVHWLSLPESIRPHLIMFYFDEPDHTGHGFGPISPETRQVVARCDSMVGLLMRKINQLPIANKINLMVVSDHGMGQVSNTRKIEIPAYIKTEWIHRINGGNPALSIEPAKGCYDSIWIALKNIGHIKVWDKTGVPGYLHYGTNSRINQIVVLADSSYSLSKYSNSKITGGAHGYDPKNTDIHAIFYAMGPAFKKGYLSASFENIHLYSLMAKILNLVPAKTDGDINKIADILKP